MHSPYSQPIIQGIIDNALNTLHLQKTHVKLLGIHDQEPETCNRFKTTYPLVSMEELALVGTIAITFMLHNLHLLARRNAAKNICLHICLPSHK